MAVPYKKTVLATIIEKARENIGLTQGELAATLHIGQQSVSKWETGENRPKPQAVPQLAAVLGLDQHLLLAEAGYLRDGEPDAVSILVRQAIPGENPRYFMVTSWDLEVIDVDAPEPGEAALSGEPVVYRREQVGDPLLLALNGDTDLPEEIRQAVLAIVAPYKGQGRTTPL